MCSTNNQRLIRYQSRPLGSYRHRRHQAIGLFLPAAIPGSVAASPTRLTRNDAGVRPCCPVRSCPQPLLDVPVVNSAALPAPLSRHLHLLVCVHGDASLPVSKRPPSPRTHRPRLGVNPAQLELYSGRKAHKTIKAKVGNEKINIQVIFPVSWTIKLHSLRA